MVVVLPAPLGPMKPNTSPCVELEVEPVDGEQVAVFLGQIAGFDHNYFCSSGRTKR